MPEIRNQLYMEFAAQLRPKSIPSLPICGRGARQSVQHAGLTHEGLRDGMGLRDVGQFGVEHASEGEQVVALVLQRHAQRSNAPQVLRLTFHQLLDDEIEQHLPRGQARPSQRQNVMAQPLSERSDVAGQSLRLGLGLPRKFNGQFVVRTKPTRAVNLGLELLAPRPGTLGEARQCVGEAFAIV